MKVNSYDDNANVFRYVINSNISEYRQPLEHTYIAFGVLSEMLIAASCFRDKVNLLF